MLVILLNIYDGLILSLLHIRCITSFVDSIFTFLFLINIGNPYKPLIKTFDGRAPL